MGTKPIAVIRSIIVALKWPRKIPDRIAKSKEILAKLTGNPDFPVPYPSNVASLSQLESDIGDVDDAQTDVRNRVIGAVQDRNTKLDTVKLDLESIMYMVQIKADNDPENAEGMIKGAGFDYVFANHRQKQKLGVKSTNVSGSYILLAGEQGDHEWEITDDKINIKQLPATSAAHTLVTELTLFKTYYQRNRKIGTNGAVFDWSPWFEFTVT
jgi:hypothetical protein